MDTPAALASVSWLISAFNRSSCTVPPNCARSIAITLTHYVSAVALSRGLIGATIEPVTTTTPEAQLGQTLRQWRESADMRLDDVAAWVSHELPRSMRVSRELIRRYEAGAVDYRVVNPWVIGAIAVVTGHKVSELPEPVQEDIKRLSDLELRMSRWTEPLPA